MPFQGCLSRSFKDEANSSTFIYIQLKFNDTSSLCKPYLDLINLQTILKLLVCQYSAIVTEIRCNLKSCVQNKV